MIQYTNSFVTGLGTIISAILYVLGIVAILSQQIFVGLIIQIVATILIVLFCMLTEKSNNIERK